MRILISEYSVMAQEFLLYHGTKKNFKNFDLRFFNSGSGDGGWLGYGIYLTNDYEYAESYGDILECSVFLKNPYILKDYSYSTSPNKLAEELNVNSAKGISATLMKAGYDSVLLTYSDDFKEEKFIELCVFNPSDVKILKRYKQGDDSDEVMKKRGY